MSLLKTMGWLLGATLLVSACGGGTPTEGETPDGSEVASDEAMAEKAAMLEENKQVASEFFRSGITAEERLALLHPDYMQHNPVFRKFADENGISYYEGFAQMFARRGGGGGRGGGGNADADAPQPPPGNNLYLVMAEDDLVFIMRQSFRQDPNEEPGTFYEAFSWDTFRIRDGLLYEHWDGATIQAANN
jgi:predicted SnoaL-like aldol condensation-catalyzing enzyme